MQLPNVRILDSTRVMALLVEDGVVRGVRIQQLREAKTSLGADLVVDASGRASKTPEWLEGLGYDRPDVEEVKVGIGYTTRIYKRLPGISAGIWARSSRRSRRSRCAWASCWRWKAIAGS